MSKKEKGGKCVIIGLIVLLFLCCCSSSALMGFIYFLKNAEYDIDPSGIEDFFTDVTEDTNEPFFEVFDDTTATESAVAALREVRTRFYNVSGYKFDGQIQYPDGIVEIEGVYLKDGSESYLSMDDEYGDISEITYNGVYYIDYGYGWEITDEPFQAGIQRKQITYLLENADQELEPELEEEFFVYSYYDAEYDESFVLFVDPDTMLPAKLEYDYYSDEYEDYVSEVIEYSRFSDPSLTVEIPEIE